METLFGQRLADRGPAAPIQHPHMRVLLTATGIHHRQDPGQLRLIVQQVAATALRARDDRQDPQRSRHPHRHRLRHRDRPVHLHSALQDQRLLLPGQYQRLPRQIGPLRIVHPHRQPQRRPGHLPRQRHPRVPGQEPRSQRPAQLHQPAVQHAPHRCIGCSPDHRVSRAGPRPLHLPHQRPQPAVHPQRRMRPLPIGAAEHHPLPINTQPSRSRSLRPIHPRRHHDSPITLRPFPGHNPLYRPQQVLEALFVLGRGVEITEIHPDPAGHERRQHHIIQQHRHHPLNTGHGSRHGRRELLLPPRFAHRGPAHHQHHGIRRSQPLLQPLREPAAPRHLPLIEKHLTARPVQILRQYPHPCLVLMGVGDEHVPPLHHSALPNPPAATRRRRPHQRLSSLSSQHMRSVTPRLHSPQQPGCQDSVPPTLRRGRTGETTNPLAVHLR